MTKTNIKTTTYKVDQTTVENFFNLVKENDPSINLYDSFESDMFMIDVVDDGITFSAYLYDSTHGTKMFIFGIEKKDVKIEDDFAEIVENNLIGEMYLAIYCEDETGEEVCEALKD